MRQAAADLRRRNELRLGREGGEGGRATRTGLHTVRRRLIVRLRRVDGCLDKRRHHLHIRKLARTKILLHELTNCLAVGRAREAREIPVQVLNLIYETADVVYTNMVVHPANRDTLIEEPRKALLLVIQIGEKLREARIVRAIRVGGRLEILKYTGHLRRDLKSGIPLLKQLLPAKDAVRSVGKPKVRGHLELGLHLGEVGGVNFFSHTHFHLLTLLQLLLEKVF